MKTTAQKGVEILKQYAKENGVPLRSTSDLSPLEQWLTLKLISCNERNEGLKTIIEENK
ncbi:MAG: hypothetical protein H8E98_04580 [Bacteroidetes bacterium]|nr:hypothetical protein [Bacteroidota bacterium]